MTQPRLEIKGVCKSYPGVKALENAHLELLPGEIHCVLGENGAGKSTLIKTVGGLVKPDSGSMILNGMPYQPSTPRDAQSHGISIIHQELNLCPEMTIAENIMLGNESTRAKWLASKCTCLIFDEPTRGVDVGAKTEIYALMNELLAQGVAILMISSDLPEVLGMSDRIAVMCEGRLVGEVDASGASQERVMSLATSGSTLTS